MNKLNIAIDGPAAAGKSTVAKRVADKCSYIYIDTGAMYRALTYKAISQNVNLDDEKELLSILKNMELILKPSEQGQLVFVNGQNVTNEIRSQEVTNNVSLVAKFPAVRKEMVMRQKEMAQSGGVVMDGRDIGTEVLPNAEVKVFLLASVEERAKRRFEENSKKGMKTDLEELKHEIAQRDKMDMEREVSPLKKADDAIEIDSTSLTIDEVVDRILELVKGRK